MAFSSETGNGEAETASAASGRSLGNMPPHQSLDIVDRHDRGDLPDLDSADSERFLGRKEDVERGDGVHPEVGPQPCARLNVPFIDPQLDRQDLADLLSNPIHRLRHASTLRPTTAALRDPKPNEV